MRTFQPASLSPTLRPAADSCEALAILVDRTEQLLERLAKLEASIAAAAEQGKTHDWYSTADAAKALGLAEFTVRNYCRLGRIRGEKKGSGRGKYQSWVVSHAEIERVRREGLLPLCHAAVP
jgi:hypothetical protein